MESIEEKTKNSSFIENMIEHVFISEMLQEAWINRDFSRLDVLRSEVDDNGYDIVLSYNGVSRYIQLKTSEVNGKTATQKLNISLIEKENACIIWIIRSIDIKKGRYTFSYRFFGNKLGDKFPDIENLKIAKHTKGNSEGEKKERPNIREIPRRHFTEINSTADLFNILFIK